MGYWGGNNDDEANQLIEQQIQTNNAEIEREKQALSERRLNIIKSQGAPNWSPDIPSGPPKQVVNRSANIMGANVSFKTEVPVKGGA